MMRATSSAWASVIVVAKLFQLFQPIGGVGASSGPLPAGVTAPRWRGHSAANAAAPPMLIISRLLLAKTLTPFLPEPERPAASGSGRGGGRALSPAPRQSAPSGFAHGDGGPVIDDRGLTILDRKSTRLNSS